MLGTLLITARCAGGTSFEARDRQYAPLAATQAITPAEAIRRAAEAAPRGVEGRFTFTVKATGRAEGNRLFLNSEADYRDQRNIHHSSGREEADSNYGELFSVGPAFGTYNALPPEGLIAVRFGLGDRHDPGAAYLLGQLGSPLRGGAKSPPRLKSRRLDRPADVTTAQPICLLRTREHEAGGDHR